MNKANRNRAVNVEVFIPKDLRIAQPKKNYTMVRKDRKMGRNEPCSCGSGKKAKKCCYSPYH